MGKGRALLEHMSERQSPETYRQEHWQGSFDEYLDIVRETLSHGTLLPSSGLSHTSAFAE